MPVPEFIVKVHVLVIENVADEFEEIGPAVETLTEPPVMLTVALEAAPNRPEMLIIPSVTWTFAVDEEMINELPTAFPTLRVPFETVSSPLTVRELVATVKTPPPTKSPALVAIVSVFKAISVVFEFWVHLP